MSVELLQNLSMASYILAGVLFITSVALFFLLDVTKIFGDITGTTARKAIETIRQQNESTGDKAYKPSAVNIARGKLTDKISLSGRLEPRKGASAIALATEKFSTTKLSAMAEETSILSSTINPSNITTILSSENKAESQANVNGEFEVEIEMGYLGSNELID